MTFPTIGARKQITNTITVSSATSVRREAKDGGILNLPIFIFINSFISGCPIMERKAAISMLITIPLKYHVTNPIAMIVAAIRIYLANLFMYLY